MKTPLQLGSFPRRARGSAFVTVMMFTMVMFLLVGSILKWSLTERRMNMRNASWLEARNAAEAVADFGFSQVVKQFGSYAIPPTFEPGSSNALALPPSAFFSGGAVNTAAYSSSNPNGLELIGGTVSRVPTSGALFYIDPNNPDNEKDPLKGQWVYRRDVQVLARATVVPTLGSPITARVTQKVSVRGAPLFAFAVFYDSNDLEAAPGPVLDIYGPVHVNGNMLPLAQGTVETGTANSVNFRGPVTMTGHLYHAWRSEKVAAQGRGYSSSSSTIDGEPLGHDPVTFVNRFGNQVNMRASNGVWKDSTMGDLSSLLTSQGRYLNTSTPGIDQLATKLNESFRDYAAQAWHGNVQTAAHGVQPYHPIAFGHPINSAGDLPDPHALIEAPTTVDPSDPYATAKEGVEDQKFSNQTGLYIEVKVTAGDPNAAATADQKDSAVITLYGPPNSAPTGTPAEDIGPNGGLRLGTYDTGQTPNGMVKFVPFHGRATGITNAPATRRVISANSNQSSGGMWRYRRTVVTTTGGTLSVTGDVYLNGHKQLRDLDPTTGNYSGGSASTENINSGYTYASSAAATTAGNAAYPVGTTYTVTGALTTNITSTSGADVLSGMFDQREGHPVNLVQIDMKKLKGALDAAVSGSNPGGNTAITDASNGIWGGAASVGGGWNGGIYVDVKSATGTGHPGKTSVALANGKVASGSNLLPTVNNVSGLMIATNAPVYTVGHFNSDGANASSAPSATTPDDGKTNAANTPTSAQIPIAIAADAITILSPNYFGTEDSTDGSDVPATNATTASVYTNFQNARNNASGSCEVAAAFITGIVKTTDSDFSGGVHNLPRFLEHWGTNSVAIRGSLVSLYSSQVADGPWAQRYYSAPRRVWGFDKTFSNGTFPPLTPKVMSYRRVDFTDLNATQFETARHALWPSHF